MKYLIYKILENTIYNDFDWLALTKISENSRTFIFGLKISLLGELEYR